MEVSKHFSHRHALRPFKVREGDQGFRTCSGCERDVSAGSAYRCTKPKCDFFLHSSCFSLPPQLHHGSHPKHTLTLLSPPPYAEEEFICNACGETSSAFTYHCSLCTYDLHVGCAHLPYSVKRDDHPHPLNLLFPGLVPETEDSDNQFLSCNVCYGSVTEQCWVYCCEQCKFNTHLDCAPNAADQPEQVGFDITGEGGGGDGGGEQEGASDHFASLMAAQNQLQLLQFQNRMAYQNARLMTDLGSSLAKLA